jgi:hypothetical protein
VKGDVATKRIKFKWGRWEATEELGPSSWAVAYGLTRRGALRALRTMRGRA